MRRVVVSHTLASLHSSHGGPSRSVTALCDALATNGTAIHLMAGRDDEEGEDVLPENPLVQVHLHDSSLSTIFRNRYGLVRERSERQRIVHDHGVWLPTNIASAVAARRAGVPLIVSTRGMLEPWAIAYRSWKKKAAWLGYQKWILAGASVLHATSEAELESIRAMGLGNPVAVIPNGVTLPVNAIALSDTSIQRKRKKALFLSRIHPKKGLPMLLEAWREVAPEDWELIIAGPDEEHHTAELVNLVRKLGLQEAVSFPGSVADDDKWSLYADSDLFILPTHSENFGIVVAEAMAAGLPVITTKGAPWSVLNERDCGWWTDISAAAIASALKEATLMSPEKLAEMGRRGAEYVQDNLSWDTVARQMLEVYEWVLSGGTPPSTVHVS